MPRELPVYQVDAFTSEVFGGNPAAVCPLDQWLPDDVMQAVAAENNLSETAFIVKRDEGYDLRWFTPAIEVDICGHATLASAFVIANNLEAGRDKIVFHSRSGPLTVTRDGELYTLDFPAKMPERVDDLAAVEAALGVRPLELWRNVKDYFHVWPFSY